MRCKTYIQVHTEHGPHSKYKKINAGHYQVICKLIAYATLALSRVPGLKNYVTSTEESALYGGSIARIESDAPEWAF